jgi:hypothetical protein
MRRWIAKKSRSRDKKRMWRISTSNLKRSSLRNQIKWIDMKRNWHCCRSNSGFSSRSLSKNRQGGRLRREPTN